jgi:PLD-like domain
MQSHFKNIKSVLLNHLNSAQSSINIAVAWFTDADIFEALISKRQAGLKIIVALSNDDKNFHESYSLNFEPLKSIGGQVIVVDMAFMHHKFCIIDEKLLLTGTANYTYNGFHKNKENVFEIEDNEIIQEFLKEFKSLINFFEFETGLTLHNGKEKLKKAIALAFQQIDFLEVAIAEAHKSIELYDVKYRLRFRDIILEILYLQNLKLEQKAKLTDKQEDKEFLTERNAQYQQIVDGAQADAKIETASTDLASQKTLKELFREAVKLCHPDNAFINEAIKQKASQIFIKIKEAYSNNDILTISLLLEELKAGTAFSNVNYDEMQDENLNELLAKLQDKIQLLSNELTILHKDNKFTLMADNVQLERHYDKEEMLLKERLRVLKGN